MQLLMVYCSYCLVAECASRGSNMLLHSNAFLIKTCCFRVCPCKSLLRCRQVDCWSKCKVLAASTAEVKRNICCTNSECHYFYLISGLNLHFLNIIAILTYNTMMCKHLCSYIQSTFLCVLCGPVLATATTTIISLLATLQ